LFQDFKEFLVQLGKLVTQEQQGLWDRQDFKVYLEQLGQQEQQVLCQVFKEFLE
jgi:hypothetical protein